MKLNLLIATLLITATTVFADLPKVGDTAPSLEGKDQNDQTVKLSDYLGKKNVLLYFYPKDFTKGCTKEACGFRDRMNDLQTNNVAVVGVSFDTSHSHKQFADQYQLQFPLIADTDGAISKTYGVKMADKNMSRRVSFLINTDGKIVHVTDSSNAQVHFDEMKDAIAGLKKN